MFSSYHVTALLASLFLLTSGVSAQLRVVTYNTATAQSSGVQTARDGVDVVLKAIGDEVVNGVAKPIDILLLQEQFSTAVSTQSFLDILDDIYGAGVYARSTLNGVTSSPDREGGAPALVYNTQTVELVGETRIGRVGGSPHQPRSTMRLRLRPKGYDSSADLYVYNSHYKASTGSTNELRRLEEACRNRLDADSLGDGASIIYAGDFNIQSSNEAMYQELLAPGPGQAFDPIDIPGTWHNNGSEAFERTHTQSPRSGGASSTGLIGGGVDDRFDFQLVTGELLDNEGLSYIAGSYHAFGNNGSHECCNDSITAGNGASPTVLSALTTASDHLPVVADYQIPAVLEVLTDSLPETLTQGEEFSLDVTIRNAASVLAAIGADELDYQLTVTGDLSGQAAGSLMALAVGDLIPVQFDTSVPGTRSGVLTVSTDSQGAANALFELPISYEVIASSLAGDFNLDGVVDAADYTVWRDGLGAEYNQQDYLDWRASYGQTSVAKGITAAPEPLAALLAVAATVIVTPRRRRLRRGSPRV